MPKLHAWYEWICLFLKKGRLRLVQPITSKKSLGCHKLVSQFNMICFFHIVGSLGWRRDHSHFKGYLIHYKSDLGLNISDHSHFKRCPMYCKTDLGPWQSDYNHFKSYLSHYQSELEHRSSYHSHTQQLRKWSWRLIIWCQPLKKWF